VRAVSPVPRVLVISAWICFLGAAIAGTSDEVFAIGGIAGGALLVWALLAGLTDALDPRMRRGFAAIVGLLAAIAIGGGIALLV
jgi:hypothetical protein